MISSLHRLSHRPHRHYGEIPGPALLHGPAAVAAPQRARRHCVYHRGCEPTEYLSEIENTQPTVYFFAELEDLNGQTAIHRWKYQDKVMAEVKVPVTSPRVKAWSSLSMQPEWTGVWVVEAVNGRGEVISTSTFSYLEPL